jgi:hypothetical protein
MCAARGCAPNIFRSCAKTTVCTHVFSAVLAMIVAAG